MDGNRRFRDSAFSLISRKSWTVAEKKRCPLFKDNLHAGNWKLHFFYRWKVFFFLSRERSLSRSIVHVRIIFTFFNDRYMYRYMLNQLFLLQQPLFSDPYTVHARKMLFPQLPRQPCSSLGIHYPFYHIQQVMFYPKLSKIFIFFLLNRYRYTFDSSKYPFTYETVSNYIKRVASLLCFFFFIAYVSHVDIGTITNHIDRVV